MLLRINIDVNLIMCAKGYPDKIPDTLKPERMSALDSSGMDSSSPIGIDVPN